MSTKPSFWTQERKIWRALPDDATKHCPTCDQDKPLAAFNKNKARPDGLQVYCILCQRTYNNAWSKSKYESDEEYYKLILKRSRNRRRDLYQTDASYREEMNRKNRERYATDPEFRRKTAEASKRWVANNPEKSREKKRLWVENNAERLKENNRNWVLKSKYGLTREDYDAMIAAQHGRCAICRSDNPGATVWNVDHCHRTGRVRGILCGSCNRALGLFNDDPQACRAAALYLEESVA